MNSKMKGIVGGKSVRPVVRCRVFLARD